MPNAKNEKDKDVDEFVGKTAPDLAAAGMDAIRGRVKPISAKENLTHRGHDRQSADVPPEQTEAGESDLRHAENEAAGRKQKAARRRLNGDIFIIWR